VIAMEIVDLPTKRPLITDAGGEAEERVKAHA
jgi:hypothetical protein